MNKKFLSVILFSALMVGTAGTFTSCKDYDDDIDNLQEQITSNKDAIAALESQIKSGEWVSSVTSTDNGIVVTLGNGTSYPITNGEKGEAGKDGMTPKIAVNNGKIQVSYDNGTTWTDLISLEDLKGEAGDAAATPIFSVGEDGHIYVQYGEAGEKKDLGVSTGGIYYVEDGAKLTIHIPNKDGEYKDIVLPRAAAISSIKAVTIDTDAKLTDGASIELAYGKAAADGKYFDGTAFKEGDILLPSKEAKNVISAQVNPTIADATVYNFYLANSKGYSIFNLAAATPNMTEGALTRTATANKGVYDMGITFIDGVTAAQIDKAKGAYAIATKDAYDNEVLSSYDVTVDVKEATTTTLDVTATTTQEVEINKELDLNDCVDMENVIDVQYYFATNQTAAVDAAKATITGTKIKGEVANKTVVVSVKYLTYNGEVKDATKTITVRFINPATENAFTQTLVLNADASKNVLTFDVTSLIGNTTSNASSFFTNIGDAKFTAAAKDKNSDTDKAKGDVAVGITAPTAVVTANASTTPNGYYKHTLTYTVDNATVIPGTYEAELTYGSSPVNTVKLTLIVEENVASYDFKPLDLYFTGTNATAYGTPDVANSKITYNLKGLFGITTWANIAFTETVPESYKDADGIQWTANAWLADATSGDITVDKVATKNEAAKTGNFGGAYEARSLKAIYTPYANKNLTATAYDFTLTIKSSVFEGSLNYVKKVVTKNDEDEIIKTEYVAGDNKTINVAAANAKATLKAEEIRGITKTNVIYFGNSNLTNAYVASVSVALEGDAAKQYLDLAGDFTNDDVTITPKANVTIPGDGKTVTCYVRVSVVDEWGKTKTVDVPVVLQ
ncbi:PL29 family lyase N-terminal domain-containing protein [Bacteroides uniformis]|uniref:PL29 family lyase N-terminal domain-containing protein n=1 Tax=Bacteroides uniformis TaxID=820 RepID=UPI0018978706|nr:PL29 family lyase N-terminal domain-containing protein [Bacteroides uniformis]